MTNYVALFDLPDHTRKAYKDLRVGIIGAGPLGLTAANLIAAAGGLVEVVHDHPVVPRERPRPGAVPAGWVAAGIVELFGCLDPDAARRIATTMAFYDKIAGNSDFGIASRHLVVYATEEHRVTEDWMMRMPGFSPTVSPVPECAFAAEMETFMLHPMVYLQQLRAVARHHLGVQFTSAHVTAEELPKWAKNFDAVVLAAGLGNAGLARDTEVEAITGFLIKMDRPGEASTTAYMRLDPEVVSYYLPRGNVRPEYENRPLAIVGGNLRHEGCAVVDGDYTAAAEMIEEILGNLDAGLPTHIADKVRQSVATWRPTFGQRPGGGPVIVENITIAGVPGQHLGRVGGSGFSIGFTIARDGVLQLAELLTEGGSAREICSEAAESRLPADDDPLERADSEST